MARFEWNDKQVLAQTMLSVDVSVKESCELITKESKNIMKSGSYAEYYSKKKDGSKHWASKPWDAPAPDTKLLKGSISYKTSTGKSGGIQPPASSGDGVKQPPSEGRWKIIGVVGTNVSYGYYLEMGTSKMTPRPYLRPPLTNNSHKIFSIFVKNGRIALK